MRAGPEIIQFDFVYFASMPDSLSLSALAISFVLKHIA